MVNAKAECQYIELQLQSVWGLDLCNMGTRDALKDPINKETKQVFTLELQWQDARHYLAGSVNGNNVQGFLDNLKRKHEPEYQEREGFIFAPNFRRTSYTHDSGSRSFENKVATFFNQVG